MVQSTPPFLFKYRHILFIARNIGGNYSYQQNCTTIHGKTLVRDFLQTIQYKLMARKILAHIAINKYAKHNFSIFVNIDEENLGK